MHPHNMNELTIKNLEQTIKILRAPSLVSRTKSISVPLLYDVMTLRHEMHAQYSVTFQSLFYRRICLG